MASEQQIPAPLTVDGHPVDATVLGVFEGGGVKGVLYTGALHAMVEKRHWFSAVAGSSTGAITAALIAGGLGPSGISEVMPGGLKAMAAPSTWRGLWRVRAGAGFLDREQVRVWLRNALRNRGPSKQSKEEPPQDDTDRGPTFEELYDPQLGGTGIDLYVVAVDLKHRHVMVFNHLLTPKCPVADAVMASATIPVAFEPLMAIVPEAEGPLANWFVADGGMASNFPDFVFQDEGFRRYAGLGERPQGSRIIGFLLDEASKFDDAQLKETYKRIDHLRPWGETLRTIKEFTRSARKGQRPDETAKSNPEHVGVLASRRGRPQPDETTTSNPNVTHSRFGSMLWTIERAVHWPIGFLLRQTQREDWWSWPEPKNRHLALWAPALRLGFNRGPGLIIGGVAVFVAMYWIGFISVVDRLWPDLKFSRLEDVASTAWNVLVGGTILAVAIWLFLLGIGAFLLMLVSYRTVGLIGHHVWRAFLQAPAAPPWVGLRQGETVIRLRVPRGITTLRVEPSVNLSEEIKTARESTARQLEEMLSQGDLTDDWFR